MDKSEQRLTTLEENGYFMEARLKTLDEQVAAHQAQLDTLAKNVELLRQRLGEIRDFLAVSHQGSNGDIKPPHHIAKFW